MASLKAVLAFATLAVALGLPSSHPDKLGLEAEAQVSSDSAPTAPAPTPLSTSDWMGELADVIGDQTLLDISVPGAHDTLTFDLGHVWPYNADTPSSVLHLEKPISTPPLVSGFMNSVLAPDRVGDLAVGKCQTQHATLTEQLDGGIRFLDWRMTQGSATIHDSHEAFLGTHTIATDHSAAHWMKELLAWLEAHPKEIVTLWMSSHGDGSLGCGDHNEAKNEFCGDTMKLPEEIKSKVPSCQGGGEVDEEFLDDFKDKVKGKIDEGKDWAKDKVDKGKDWAKDKVDDAKDWATDKASHVPAKVIEDIISNYGTYQFPGKVSTTKKFMDWLVTEAGDKIINVLDTPVDKTTLNELWAKKKQLLVYAAGYCELSGLDVKTKLYRGGEEGIEPGKTVDGVTGTPYAYPYAAAGWKLNRLRNERGGTTMTFQGKPGELKAQVNEIAGAGAKKKEFKAKNLYYVLTMVTSARTDEAIASAKVGTFDSVSLLDFPSKLQEKADSMAQTLTKADEAGKACGSFYEIEGADTYCPATTFDQAALVNYYLQFSLGKAFDAGYDFPNTIYVDGLTSDGKGRLAIGDGKSYPYSELFIHVNYRNMCGTDGATPADPAKADACKALKEKLPELDTTPVTWNNPADGRLTTVDI